MVLPSLLIPFVRDQIWHQQASIGTQKDLFDEVILLIRRHERDIDGCRFDPIPFKRHVRQSEPSPFYISLRQDRHVYHPSHM